MKENSASTTAWAVAMARYAHTRFDAPPHVFDDSLAFELVDPEFQKMIDMFAPSERVPDEVYRNRPYLAFRQRYQEACLRRAYVEGARQFVILGAGIDTYAFRQEQGLEELAIFEVDFPATQRDKKGRIKALGWNIPENLVFAPCDFETQSLTSALQEVGFDRAVPTYYAWMGVTVYLQRDTIEDTLRQVRALSPSCSSIAFEYALPLDDLQGADRACREFSLAQAEIRQSEPYVSSFSTDDISALLNSLGYSRLEALDHVSAELALMGSRSDGLGIHHGFRLMRACW